MTAHLSGKLDDYACMRTIPGVIGIGFAVASAYQFGAISEVHLAWLDYTLTAEHATLFSLAAFALAFMSSETKEFMRYDEWEQVMIAAAPATIISYQYVGFVSDIFANNDPTLHMVAFAVTLASWGVAVR